MQPSNGSSQASRTNPPRPTQPERRRARTPACSSPDAIEATQPPASPSRTCPEMIRARSRARLRAPRRPGRGPRRTARSNTASGWSRRVQHARHRSGVRPPVLPRPPASSQRPPADHGGGGRRLLQVPGLEAVAPRRNDDQPRTTVRQQSVRGKWRSECFGRTERGSCWPVRSPSATVSPR